MTTIALLGLGGVGLIVALMLSTTSLKPNEASTKASNEQEVSNAPRAFQTSWQDETQYIVESVLLDLAGMSIVARTGNPFPQNELSVATREKRLDGKLSYVATLNLPGGQLIEGEVVLDGSVWDPRAYGGIAEKLCQGIAPVRAELDAERLIKNLTEPTVDGLVKEDDYLSSFLQSNPSDPSVHVGASILMGAFALRENSGKFFTIRAELNRITAHLAFATALEKVAEEKAGAGAVGRERQLAEGIHLALQNNQTEALRVLEELPEDSVYGAWKRALNVRCTGDYRPLLGKNNRTWLEARETARAGVDRVSAVDIISSPSWKEVFGQTFEIGMGSMTDWLRTLAMRPGSIAVKHLLYGQSQLLSGEILEAKQAHEKIKNGDPGKQQIVNDLNERVMPFGAGRGRGVDAGGNEEKQRVLDWSFWAGQSQRHICNAVVDEADMLQTIWGVEERAADFRKQSAEVFSTLRLYPFVKVVSAVDQEDYKMAQEEARKVMMESPEEVGPEIWNHTCYTNPYVELYIPPPHAYVNEWHRHNPPPGTAYDPLPRMNQPSLVDGPGAVGRIEELHQRAPYDRNISFNLLRVKGKKDGRTLPYQEFYRIYSPIAEYDVVAMVQLANKAKTEGDEEEYKKLMTQAIKFSPDYRPSLASYHRGRGEDEEAVAIYLPWIEETTDLVSGEAAMYVVDYLETNGRGDEAEKVADRVAESYSVEGLLTKAILLEKRGDWVGAYEEHKKIFERYDDSSSLVPFLERAVAPSVKDQLPDAVAEDMDNRLVALASVSNVNVGERVQFQKSGQAPEKGVYVQIDDDTTRKVGLVKGDIIVAVRGYQTDNWETFKFLRNLNLLEPYVVTVWRNDSYIDLPPIPSIYRFSGDLDDYSREKP